MAYTLTWRNERLAFTQLTIGILMFLGLTMPWATHAASTSRPSCELAITTSTGSTTITKSGDVYFQKGNVVDIAWSTKNATKVTDKDGDSLSLQGSVTSSPSKVSTYTYRASNSRAREICSVTLYPVTGTISSDSLTSTSRTPTLHGTVTGTKSVRIIAQKVGSNRVAYSSGTLKVTKGIWRSAFSKKLSTGTYTVSLVGAKNIEQNLIATGTLYIGTKARPAKDEVAKSGSTLAVASIPLLAGGVARAGTIVPVAYLQMTNIGKETLTLTGIGVTARGSAPTALFTALSTVDGTGSVRSSTDASKSGKLFTNNKGFVPVSNATFAPGQMRLFTVKAALSPAVGAALGTSMIIDIASVETNGTAHGKFPIRGVTWVVR